VPLANTTAGDPMNKSGTLITSALLTFGIAAAAMAADTQPPAPTVGPKEDQRAVDTSPPKSAKSTTSTHKHKKKQKPATPAPTTTK
jgi:hypothetical protein